AGVGGVLERDEVLLSWDSGQRLAQRARFDAVEIDGLIAVGGVPDVGLGQVDRAAWHAPARQRRKRSWVLVGDLARTRNDWGLEAPVLDAIEADLEVTIQERVVVAVAARQPEPDGVTGHHVQRDGARVGKAVRWRVAAVGRPTRLQWRVHRGVGAMR